MEVVRVGRALSLQVDDMEALMKRLENFSSGPQ